MNTKKKSIYIIANCTWYIFNFRLELLKKLNEEGYKVFLFAAKDKYYSELTKYLYHFERLYLIRGSENPFLEFITFMRIFYLYKKYKPYLVHHFTIKPSIYGAVVARIYNTKNVINHITGLGPSFFSKRLKIKLFNKILKPIYKFGFNNENALNIFHNGDDRDIFIKQKLTSIKNTKVIYGSGVDIGYFKKNKIKTKFNKEVQILFPARIIREKGIIELINACNQLWSENYKFKLNLAGEIDKQNKTHLTKKNIDNIIKNKNINLLGKTHNMRDIYYETDFVVLPTWREGLSMSILESASMSLPIITTNVPGCKEVIKNDFSGLLVPPKNINELKSAIKKFLLNPNEAINYGKNARKSVIYNFSLKRINNQILSTYELRDLE